MTNRLLHVVADHEDNGDFMVGGVVTVADLLGFGGAHNSPGRLTYRAQPGTASA